MISYLMVHHELDNLACTYPISQFLETTTSPSRSSLRRIAWLLRRTPTTFLSPLSALYNHEMHDLDLCLRYAKMQYRSLPSTQYLVFDDVVPKATSTARVAAAALYHCLGVCLLRDTGRPTESAFLVVLATKDLLQVKQEEPYGRIDVRII